MSDNTLRGRLFEAPYHVNALLAFAFPSNALSTRQRVILIQAAIRQNNVILTRKGGVQ